MSDLTDFKRLEHAPLQKNVRKLVAENQQQAETIAELQAIVDDLFERNGWAKIGWERPPERVFEHFRKLHGLEAGTPSEDTE